MTTDGTDIDNELPSAPEEDAPSQGAPMRASAGAFFRHRRPLFLPDFLKNLAGGVRISLFLPVRPEKLSSAPPSLAVLVVADVVINVISSFLLVGSGGTFSFSSFPYFLFHLPFMLLGGLLAGKLLRRPELLREVPVALISLSIVLELYHYLLEWVSRLPPLHSLQDYLEAPNYYRFFWWWVCAALLFLLRIPAPPLSRRLAALPLFLMLVVLPLWCFPRGDLWVGSSGGREGGELHLTDEVLSAQYRLLDRELASLKGGEKKTPHLIFVGFAGDASQDVFTREVSAAEELFISRFGTGGRSIMLANNPQTATTIPFATAENLERTLVRVGQVMNREEDVLFLFLTSHGSADHVLTVDNAPLELEGLTPEGVRRMLKKSGIKWKVLVVSACYSGGFLEPLKDDSTLIMTAADATHESFGCGYGEKFTWFGDALLNEGLKNSYSFADAFEKARLAIDRWEKEQGETPSNPQLFVGKGIAPRLDRLERSLLAGEKKRKGNAGTRRGAPVRGEESGDPDGA